MGFGKKLKSHLIVSISPTGLSSKNRIGAAMTPANSFLCKLIEEFMQILKNPTVLMSEVTNRSDIIPQ